jgi:hypothetical protein
MEKPMTDLLPEDQALLDAARDGHEPTKRDRSRVRAALITQLGVGAGLTVAANTSAAAIGPAGLAAASGGVAAAAKGLAAIAIVAVLGGGGVAAYWVARAPAAPVITRPLATALGPAPVIATVRAAEPAPPSAYAAPIEPVRAEPSRPAAAPSRRGASGSSPGAPDSTPRAGGFPTEPSGPPQHMSTMLENETRLIRGGIAALHAGDAAGALALFDEHARRYPSGTLAEERDAERVTALCDLRRNAEAAAEAAAFLQSHPRSTLASRVGAVCAPTNP